jgi:hypothetical protein
VRAMRTTLGVLGLAGMATALVACGGAADPEATAADAEAKADAARIRLERCLRENGVDPPERQAGRRTVVRVDATKMRAAMQKCRKYREAAFGTVTPEQREEFRDAAAKFAACMRQNGVDVPDPQIAGGDEAQAAPRAGATRVDRESPKTQAAMKKCEDKLPRGGGPGGGVRFAAPPTDAGR